MRKLIVCAGHSDVTGKDNGIVTPYGNEGQMAVEFRDMIIKAGAEIGLKIKTDANSNVLADTMRWLKNLSFGLTPSDVAIEIHFNGGGGTGVEALIPMEPSSLEKELASTLCKTVASNMHLHNRGVKRENEGAHRRLGWMRIPCENILLEVCFLDRKSDVELYNIYKQQTAKAIVNVLAQL